MTGYDTEMNQAVYMPMSSCKEKCQSMESSGTDVGQEDQEDVDKDVPMYHNGDDYHVKGELGRGNFSRVKLAVHTLTGGGDVVLCLKYKCLSFFFRDGCFEGD